MKALGEFLAECALLYKVIPREGVESIDRRYSSRDCVLLVIPREGVERNEALGGDVAARFGQRDPERGS